MNSKPELKTLFENFTNYVDNHVMEMRLAIGALGLIGAGVVLRSIRFATKFYDNNKIPKSFVAKNMRLRGVVKSVSIDGTLNVDHIPIIQMPWNRKSNNERLLSVALAATQPTIPGVYWLKLNVENKTVWFKIVSKDESDINCIVSDEKKVMFKKNINSELVYRGLAYVKPWDHKLSRIDCYKRLYKTLIENQSKAQKKNRGVWFAPTKWNAFTNQLQNYFNFFKKLRNL